MPNVKKGGTTLCRTPFPTSVFPCQIASLQGGTTLCRTPPLPHIRSSLPDCLFAGGATLCRTPFPSSVFPCQNASLQGGATLCRTPFNPIPNH